MKVTYELEYRDGLGEWVPSAAPATTDRLKAENLLYEMSKHLAVEYRIVQVTREVYDR